MGNILAFCSKQLEADREDSGNTMANHVVYQTTPFDGQKPGTSGNLP
jgi:hypothetical protein